jgi:hypothetical protein
MEKTMSRRAALGALASTAAVVVPFAPAAAEAMEPPAAINIEELAVQFRDAAMKLDPRINDCWIGYDEIADGPRDMRVMSVYLGRKETPFVKPAVTRPETIIDLFEQWRTERLDQSNESERQSDARFQRYAELQRRITGMRPRNVREAAIQLVVETDDGDSDFRPEFFDRFRLVAQGV